MKRDGWVFRYEMKTADETAEVMIYSAIDSEKWWGDETTPKDFDEAMKDAKKRGCRNLSLRVNSPGGDVYSAVAMRSMIINAGFERVTVMIEGLCASAAALFATVPGAHVVIAEGSEFMVHNPMTIAWGNAAEMEKTMDHLHKMEEQFHGMYAMRTGKSEEQVKAWMDAETWFTARETVEAGFADELQEAEPVAACVTALDMGMMRALYGHVPDGVKVAPEKIDSPENPVAGLSTVDKDNKEDGSGMEIKDLTMDVLRTENPALMEQIRNDAVTAERQRMEDIDALTMPGYEQMAEDAKKNGKTVMEYQRELVAAMKQKGTDFLNARAKENAPAANVTGGSSTDGENADDKSDAKARQIADFAKAMADGSDGGMF